MDNSPYEGLLLTILQLVYAIFIFILGVPAVIFQTYIPEELRKHYNESQKDKDIAIIGSFWFFIITITVQIGYLVFHPEGHMLASPLLVFNEFILFFILSVLTAGIKLFKSTNVRKKIVDYQTRRNLNFFFKHGFFNEKLLEEFGHIGNALEPGIRTQLFIDGLGKMVKKVVKNDEAGINQYNGEELAGVLSLLYNAIYHKENSAEEIDYKQALKVYKDVANAQKKGMSLLDSTEMKKHILHIGIVAINKGWTDLADQAKDILKSLPYAKAEVFKLCLHAFKNGHYTLVKIVMGHSIHKLQMIKDRKDQEPGYMPRLNNLIGYIALFYSGNDQMKEVALRYYRDLAKDLNVGIGDLVKSQALFDKNAFYEVSGHIGKLIQDIPHLPANKTGNTSVG